MLPIQSPSSSVVSTSTSSNSSSSTSLSSLVVASAPFNGIQFNRSLTQQQQQNNENLTRITKNYFENLLYSEFSPNANTNNNVSNQNDSQSVSKMQTNNLKHESYSDLKFKIQSLIQANNSKSNASSGSSSNVAVIVNRNLVSPESTVSSHPLPQENEETDDDYAKISSPPTELTYPIRGKKFQNTNII